MGKGGKGLSHQRASIRNIRGLKGGFFDRCDRRERSNNIRSEVTPSPEGGGQGDRRERKSIYGSHVTRGREKNGPGDFQGVFYVRR